jgi:hypothetical protein
LATQKSVPFVSTGVLKHLLWDEGEWKRDRVKKTKGYRKGR